jgi:hypothetical protein
MLKAICSLNYGFMSIYPVPSMITPIKWFRLLIGPGIHVNAIGLNKYIGISIILWGVWGDRVLSLMQRDLTAPHEHFFIGEIPHKKWGAEKAPNQANKTVPHKKRGELPTAPNPESLASRGLGAHLPNSPHFINTYAHIFLMMTGSVKSPGPYNHRPLTDYFLACAGVWMGGIESLPPQKPRPLRPHYVFLR